MTDDAQLLQRDVRYIPLLKGKLGELNALQEIGPLERQLMLPLIEIVPPGLDDSDASEIERELTKFLDRLASRWPVGQPIILDAGYFPDVPLAGGQMPMEFVAERAIRRGLSPIAVARPSDSSEVRRAVANTIIHGANQVCVRIAGEDLDDEIAPFGEVLPSLLAELEVGVMDAHLVLDFGAIAEGTSALAARTARYVMAELPDLDGWASVTVAAGAFPPELGAFPAEQWGEIPRVDHTFWGLAADRSRQRGLRVPSFGDYGIAHPSMPQGAGFAPAPQLRYTADEHWLVLRGRKGLRRGHAQFYDICARLVAERAEWAGPELSWGDNRILEAARSAPDGADLRVPTGNATTWRTIGTSHHLALIVNRLASPSAL